MAVAAALRLLGLWLGLLFLLGSASAHSFAPTVITLSEESTGSFRILYQAPPNGEPMTPIFPAHCVISPPAPSDPAAAPDWTGRVLSCGASGLRGHPIVMQGSDLAETLLTIHFRNEEVYSALLRRERHVVPATSSPMRMNMAQTLRRFSALGVHHILTGPDHLLLLLGLLLLVPSLRWLLLTITAFTIGHSITLALATIDLIHPPALLVEAMIALSVVFVAREVLHPRSLASSWRPTLLATLFGLLHGLGFASALREVELPANQLVLSLASFNVGVEAGQLLFVLSLLLPVHYLRRSRLVLPSGYLIGSLAMAWTFERSLLLFGKGLTP